jgi:hypothetical protein
LELASANERASGGCRLEPGTGEENSREDEAEGSPESEEGEAGLDDAGSGDLGREGEQPAGGGRPTTEDGDDDNKVDVEALERDRLREREKILIKKCKQMNSE